MLIILNSDLKDRDFQINLLNASIEYEYDYDYHEELYFYYINDYYHEIMHELFFHQIVETLNYKTSINHLLDTTILQSFMYGIYNKV